MTRVVALVADLMDRSRISAAVPDVEFSADASAVAGADAVVVDLGRYADVLGAVRTGAPGARVIAYGSHVDEAVLDKAQADGADVVLPRSRFFHDPAAAVRGVG